jgi:hypothetical protein
VVVGITVISMAADIQVVGTEETTAVAGIENLIN